MRVLPQQKRDGTTTYHLMCAPVFLLTVFGAGSKPRRTFRENRKVQEAALSILTSKARRGALPGAPKRKNRTCILLSKQVFDPFILLHLFHYNPSKMHNPHQKESEQLSRVPALSAVQPGTEAFLTAGFGMGPGRTTPLWPFRMEKQPGYI